MALLSSDVTIERVSSLYETEPEGYRDQPRFLNAACRGVTPLEPHRLLALVKEVERRLGRRPGFPNAPRPIDIDILLYGSLVLKTPDLTIPHPRMCRRAFVLVPLAEIAPDEVHPETGRTIAELLCELSTEGVRPWRPSG